MAIDYKLRKAEGLEITLNVTVTREFKIRMAVGLWLMKLGGKITGARIEVVETERAEAEQ